MKISNTLFSAGARSRRLLASGAVVIATLGAAPSFALAASSSPRIVLAALPVSLRIQQVCQIAVAASAAPSRPTVSCQLAQPFGVEWSSADGTTVSSEHFAAAGAPADDVSPSPFWTVVF